MSENKAYLIGITVGYLGTPYLFLCCNYVGYSLELQHGKISASCGS